MVISMVISVVIPMVISVVTPMVISVVIPMSMVVVMGVATIHFQDSHIELVNVSFFEFKDIFTFFHVED